MKQVFLLNIFHGTTLKRSVFFLDVFVAVQEKTRRTTVSPPRAKVSQSPIHDSIPSCGGNMLLLHILVTLNSGLDFGLGDLCFLFHHASLNALLVAPSPCLAGSVLVSSLLISGCFLFLLLAPPSLFPAPLSCCWMM